MKATLIPICLALTTLSSFAQGNTGYDIVQSNTSGNASASELGNPFGQSFRPTSMSPIFGVGLAVVNSLGAEDIHVSLFHSDASGSTLLGSPLAQGTITAAQIDAFASGGVFTPVWFPVYFDQPYAEIPGENLAFEITGGGSLDFYFAAGSSYLGGRLLGDAGKDLTFATVVPEPGTVSVGLLGAGIFGLWGNRRIGSARKAALIPTSGQ